MKVVCTFSLYGETKGAVRYAQTAQDGQAIPPTAKPDDAIIGTLYFRKAQMPKPFPQTITVIVEA